MNEVNEQNLNKKILDVAEIDIKELMQHLRVHQRFILCCLTIGFILSTIFAILSAPVYQPSTLLQVNSQANSSSALFSSASGNLTSNLGLSSALGSGTNMTQVQMALIQSSYILQPVINSLALNVRVKPKYFPIIGRYIAEHYEGETPAPAKLGLSSYAWGGEIVEIGSFNVPADNFNERFTLKVAEAGHYGLYQGSTLILKGVVHQPAVSNNGKVSLIINRIQARPDTEFYLYRASNVDTLAKLQDKLEVTELTAKNSTVSVLGSQNTGLIQLSLKSPFPLKATTILNAIADLASADSSHQKSQQSTKLLNFIKDEIPNAQKKLTEAQAQLNQYEANNGLIDLTSQSKALLQDMTFIDSQIIAAELNKAQLLQIYTAENPMVQNTESSIAALNQQKAKLNQQLSNLPTRYQTAIDLMRNVKVYNMLYTQLLMKEQQMEITNAGVGSDLSILELATPPDQALPSFKILIIFMGSLAGFILGCIVIIVRYGLNNGISDPYLIERDFGIRTVAIVPYSEIQAKNKKLFDAGQIKSLPILTKVDNHDPAIESLRSLRTALFLMLTKKSGKCVTISGIIPQIGKSFVSVNLAAILAESGKKVLLIDGDIRKGYLHQYFKKPLSPGLSELLNGVTTLEDSIQRTEFNNFDFISCGLHAQNPGDLLLSESLPKLLKRLEEFYDLIIVDTPPILAVSDASLIAKHCALNFIVVAAGKVQKHEIEIAVKQFHSHGVALDGNIFNFTNKKVQDGSKFAYHKYYTRYYKK